MDALHVDFIADDLLAPGRLGLCRCPGLHGDLDGDLAIIAEHARVLAVLIPDMELRAIGAVDLPRRAVRAGLEVVRFPIGDFDVPPDLTAFAVFVEALAARVGQGRSLVLHCQAGLGRSGTVAASLLVRLGRPPQSAIQIVRRFRPGAVETLEQERFVARFARCAG
jgi:ADP-ribosyl-[dinitrogen reductase] hydrolase